MQTMDKEIKLLQKTVLQIQMECRLRPIHSSRQFANTPIAQDAQDGVNIL